ncbi:MAG: DUF1499 domain-containing protein [Burkholderiaceae bacterium]
MRTLAVLAVIFVIVPLLLLAAGQFGLLRGKAPDDLGVRDGKLKPPSKTENSVSSQASLWKDGEFAAESAAIEPLKVRGDPAAALAKLKATLAARRDVRIVTDRPDYLHAEFETRWLRFTDDVEFWIDPAANVIQVRSASRIGRKDFGVNRARIESIRVTANSL